MQLREGTLSTVLCLGKNSEDAIFLLGNVMKLVWVPLHIKRSKASLHALDVCQSIPIPDCRVYGSYERAFSVNELCLEPRVLIYVVLVHTLESSDDLQRVLRVFLYGRRLVYRQAISCGATKRRELSGPTRDSTDNGSPFEALAPSKCRSVDGLAHITRAYGRRYPSHRAADGTSRHGRPRRSLGGYREDHAYRWCYATGYRRDGNAHEDHPRTYGDVLNYPVIRIVVVLEGVDDRMPVISHRKDVLSALELLFERRQGVSKVDVLL